MPATACLPPAAGAAGLCQGQSRRRAGDHLGDHSTPSLPLTTVEDLADTRIAQKISQLAGVGLVSISGAQRPAVRVQANLQQAGGATVSTSTTCAPPSPTTIPTRPRAASTAPRSPTPSTPTTSCKAPSRLRQHIVVAYKNGAPVICRDVATVVQGAENNKLSSWANKTPAVLINVQRQPGANVIAVVDSIKELLPQIEAGLPASIDGEDPHRPHQHHPRLGRRCGIRTGPGRGRWWCW